MTAKENLQAITTGIRNFFTGLSVEKVQSFFTGWRKVVSIIVGSVIIAGGIFMAGYITGCKRGEASCKGTKKPTIEEKEKPKPKTKYKVTPISKAKQCGDVIDMDVKLKKDDLEITGKDKCKETTRYYKINMFCPNPRHILQFQPGIYLAYVKASNNLFIMPGGTLTYMHKWGYFGFGIGGTYFQSVINTGLYGGGVSLSFQLQFQ